jgi:hypothetical protein
MLTPPVIKLSINEVDMNVCEIAPHFSYVGEKGPPRRVTAIKGDKVLFTVSGIASLQPLSLPIAKFAAWSERRVDDDEATLAQER